MKKITLLLFTMLSLLSYSAKTVDYQEVDKYIRQKLDKDKEITFVYKLNSADNTLEGYSDEGKLTAVTDLKDNPSQAAMNGMKSVTFVTDSFWSKIIKSFWLNLNVSRIFFHIHF